MRPVCPRAGRAPTTVNNTTVQRCFADLIIALRQKRLDSGSQRLRACTGYYQLSEQKAVCRSSRRPVAENSGDRVATCLGRVEQASRSAPDGTGTRRSELEKPRALGLVPDARASRVDGRHAVPSFGADVVVHPTVDEHRA